jgi:hypothetical protein
VPTDADATEDGTDPSFLIAAPGAGELSDPAAVASNYCTATRALSGECTFVNSLGTGFWKQYNVAEASGSGVFDPFVRISANTELIQGVNTSGRNLVWDENSSPTFTRDLRLDELPQTECPPTSPWGGQTCRELGLDTNQEGGDPPGIWISIDAVRIYVSPNENICDIDAPCKNGQNNPFHFDNRSVSFNLTDAELIWALDGLSGEGLANGLSTSSLIDSGSGRADVLLYLLDDMFDAYPGCDYDQGLGDDCGEYVHVYSHFGANDSNNDGYEEWNVRVLPIVIVEKTADVIADKRFTWDVDKTPDASLTLHIGDQYVHEYTIDVTKETPTLENFRAQGTITITNPDKRDPAVITMMTDVFGTTDITDELTCPFPINADGSVTPPYELAKNSSIECTYGPVDIGDDFTTATNTATVRLESGGQFEGSADASAADVTIDDTIDETATLSDDNDGSVAGQYTDSGSETYQATFACDDDVTNTATLTGDDSETEWTDTANVKVTCLGLTVTKADSLYLDRQYFWDIDKSADQTEIELSSGQSFTANYTVQVDTTGSTDSNWGDSGVITITNLHPTKAADLTSVVDTVLNGTPIVATVGTCSATTVPAGGSVTCPYTVSLPDATSRTNKATATMQNRKYYFDSTTPVDIGTTPYAGTALYDFSGATVNTIDECITVSDTFSEFGGDVEVCIDDTLPYDITYTKDFVAADYNECESTDVPNTASFITGDTGGTGDDPWTITIIRDCPSCTLTQGYWKTHNDTFTGGASKKADPVWFDLLPGLGEQTVFFLSTQTYYDVMWTAPQGNGYYLLGRQWIAASLNYAADGDGGAAVDQALLFGQELFTKYTPAQVAEWDNSTGGTLPSFGAVTRHDVIMAAATLDAYNNSDHCDDDGELTVTDDVPII